VTGLEAQELVQGGAAHDAVRRKPGVALELVERANGGVAEDAVDPARVEAKAAQALLELRHVVTPQHGGPAVEEAVAEPETGFDQGVPGLGAADAVDAQAPQALEGLEGGPGGGPEDAVDVDGRARDDGGETVLDVGDGGAAVPERQGQPYR
jgi:hypothetical protein